MNLDEKITLEESPRHSVDSKDIAKIPALLIMRRKSIVNFPNGSKAGLYLIDKLNKYITIPFDPSVLHINEENEEIMENEQTVHPVISQLQDIAKNGYNHIKFQNGKKHKIDSTTAHAILSVHDNLNHENKQKLERMAHKDIHNFSKIADFAFKHTKMG